MYHGLLDKDLLSNESDIKYSEETCCFIPQTLNNFLKYKYSKGWNIEKGTKTYRVKYMVSKTSKNIGCFKTQVEAENIRKLIRKCHARFLRKKYKRTLPKKIINKIN